MKLKQIKIKEKRDLNIKELETWCYENEDLVTLEQYAMYHFRLFNKDKNFCIDI